MARKKQRSKEEQIEYQLDKLEYHAKRLSKLGLGLDEILPKMDFAPDPWQAREITSSGLFWDQKSIWGFMLYFAWRMHIVEGSKTSCKVAVEIGPYDNRYIKVEEQENLTRAEALFFEPLGLEETDKRLVWNNARHMKVFTGTLPVPFEVMERVIELLRTKKDDVACQANRNAARRMLDQFFQ